LCDLSKIRRLDLHDLKLEYDKVLEQLGALFTNLKEQETILRERYYSGNSPTFVWVEQGIIVGTCTLYILDKLQFRNPYGILDDVAVVPEWRNKGIARQLIKYAIMYAHTRGVFKVILDCDPTLCKYYEQFGFYVNGACMRMDF
jgi:predicted N-acetyltransferase YhbS